MPVSKVRIVIDCRDLIHGSSGTDAIQPLLVLSNEVRIDFLLVGEELKLKSLPHFPILLPRTLLRFPCVGFPESGDSKKQGTEHPLSPHTGCLASSNALPTSMGKGKKLSEQGRRSHLYPVLALPWLVKRALVSNHGAEFSFLSFNRAGSPGPVPGLPVLTPKPLLRPVGVKLLTHSQNYATNHPNNVPEQKTACLAPWLWHSPGLSMLAIGSFKAYTWWRLRVWRKTCY